MARQAKPAAAPAGAADPAVLGGLSRLAGRGFADRAEASAAVLQLITRHFGLRTSHVAAIDAERQELRVVAAHNEPGGCGLEAGVTLDLQDTF